MNTGIRTLCAIAIALYGWAGQALAVTITYGVQNVGGSQWRYDYDVTNDLAAPINWFTLFFDRSSFAGLCGSADGNCAIAPGAPAGWDPLVAQPDPLLPDDGFLDLFSAGAGIAPGTTLGGFSIVFTWLGADAPGAQPFDIIGDDPASPLQSGVTTPRAPVVATSEPGSAALVSLALMGLAGWRAMLARGRRRLARVQP